MIHHSSPVSPLHVASIPQGDGAEVGGAEDLDDVVNEDDVDLGSVIVGRSPKPKDEEGVQPLRGPKEMTQAEWEEHLTRHIPYDDRCEFCTSARRPNTHHRRRRPDRQRTIPNLCADYGFLKHHQEEDAQCFLGGLARPWRVYFATMCNKGADPRVVRRPAQLIKDLGLIHFSYKSDREAAIRTLLAEAARMAGVQGELEDGTAPDEDELDDEPTDSAENPKPVAPFQCRASCASSSA